MRTIYRVLAITLLAVLTAGAQSRYSAEQAKDHVGENATVCGKVVSTRFSAGSRGQPTFLNLNKPYPNQVFTIVIWGSDRGKFGAPERDYANKSVCVTGRIEEYRGVPEVVAHGPSQLAAQ